MADEPKKERPGVIAAVVAILGTASAFLAGVDWNVLFSAEGAAVASAGVGLAGAIALFARAVIHFVEKKRNG